MWNFSFRAVKPGETATHYYVARLGSILTWDALVEFGIQHYCVVGLVQEGV